ncbi:MAG: glycosyltransferase [Lachnospiraceae bacterium]|nr:glycosyltransferase [Lachnospiraceae bacterium]
MRQKIEENISDKPFFSIIVVALNPGGKIIETFESIRAQSFTDYQVIVKDGGSVDGSMEELKHFLEQWQEGSGRVQVVTQQDSSIYDGMNQAVGYATGEYLYFLNCGDLFAHEEVLAQVADKIREDRRAGREAQLYYGDILDVLREQVVSSNPHIDAFACYRHLPCHQACLYAASLFAERGYDPSYRVRADYEHFLWCFFEKKVQPRYIPVTLAAYEGGGFSETKENIRRSAQEHKEITARYMSVGQRLRYRGILLITLAPLRKKMAESPRFAGIYQNLKRLLYVKRVGKE